MSVTTPPPPDDNQIKAWQEQWDEEKSQYTAEIEFMNETITSKTNEYTDIFDNTEEWGQISMQERSDLRQQIFLAKQELVQIQNELALAKSYFIANNPQAEHYVQF